MLMSKIRSVIEPFCQRVLLDQTYRGDLLDSLLAAGRRGVVISNDPKIVISLQCHSSSFVANAFLNQAIYGPGTARYHINAPTAELSLILLVSDMNPFYHKSLRYMRCYSRWNPVSE